MTGRAAFGGRIYSFEAELVPGSPFATRLRLQDADGNWITPTDAGGAPQDHLLARFAKELAATLKAAAATR
jgi:hypothetical protein